MPDAIQDQVDIESKKLNNHGIILLYNSLLKMLGDYITLHHSNAYHAGCSSSSIIWSFLALSVACYLTDLATLFLENIDDRQQLKSAEPVK